MATVGKVLALNGVAIVCLQPLSLQLTAGSTRTPLLVAAASLIGIGFGLCAFVSSPAGYGVTILVWTLGEIAFATVTPSLVADLAPDTQRGSYHGVFQLMAALTGVAAPIVGSAVLEHGGSRALWGGCAIVGLTTAVLHATVMAKRLGRPFGR